MRLKGTQREPFNEVIDFSCVFVLWDEYLTLRIERPCVLTNGKCGTTTNGAYTFQIESYGGTGVNIAIK